MSTYHAPLKDMQFVLWEFAGLAEIGSFPGCEDVTPDLVDAVLSEADRFAREVLDPLNRVGDEQGARFADGQVSVPAGYTEAYRKFIEGGWNSLTGDPRYDGQGLPQVVGTAVQEIWNSANMAFSLEPMLTSGVVEALQHHGTPEQQAHYLPRLTSGKWSGTMNLTEPQAGSDLSAVRTQAIPEGDHYRLRGTKIFITWGEHDMAENIVHLVLARTPNAPEGVKGISLFIVPKYLTNGAGGLGERNDVKCVSIEHKLGIHASPTCVLAYGEENGAIGYLVGEENRGLEYMFTMMNHARLGVSVEAVGIAERAYQHALEYARTRVQGRAIGQTNGNRVTIVHHPDVRRMLLRMKAHTEAMRALAYFTAGSLDRAKRHPDEAERQRSQAVVDLLTPVVKGWCTERAIEVASLGVQVHGGMGFIEESGAPQYLRDARITTIYEGTTGIQANDLVARKVAFEGGVSASRLLAEMREVDAPLASMGTEYESMRASVRDGIDALEQATTWIVHTFQRDAKAAAAVAVPYLELFGTVAGGWVLARSATLAQRKLAAPDADRDYLRTKIATARFYSEHILPVARAHAATVTRGSASVAEFEESLL